MLASWSFARETDLMNPFHKLGLLIARFCLSAWIGGAVLFVINGVRQVTISTFDSTIRNELAVLRFPPYYLFGTVLMVLALLGILMAATSPKARGRMIVVGLLIVASLGVMAYDYNTIYLPMEEMIVPYDKARPAEFMTMHKLSMRYNTAHIALALVASLLVCWPVSTPRTVEST